MTKSAELRQFGNYFTVDENTGKVDLATSNLKIDSTTGYNILQLGADDNTGYHWVNESSALNLYSGVVGSGDFQLGITSAQLAIDGNLKASSVLQKGTTTDNFIVSQGTGTQMASVAMWGADRTDFPGQVHIVSNSSNADAASGQISFWDFTGSTFNKNVTIDKNGNVGIGTDAPTTKLHVSGDITSTNILSNVKVGNSQSISFDRGAGDYSNYIRAANYPSQGYTTTDDKYWIEYGTKGGHHFVVNTDGGNTTSENAYDDFTIWQGGVDVRRVFSVSNQGNVWARGVVQGAFKEFDTTLNTTIGASNTSITWSPSLPANAWVAMSVFISSMDPDNTDHFDIKIGPSADYGSTWGETNPSSNVPYGFGILTHPGDNQGPAMGYYGMWDEVIAKTNGSGQLVFSIVGSNGGSGITVRTKGYWLP